MLDWDEVPSRCRTLRLQSAQLVQGDGGGAGIAIESRDGLRGRQLPADGQKAVRVEQMKTLLLDDESRQRRYRLAALRIHPDTSAVLRHTTLRPAVPPARLVV